MENSKTIVCPNCGAVSSNLDKCEYCGSILVKFASIFQAEGNDVAKKLDELGIGKSAYVNPSIVESIEKNSTRCKRYNATVECFYPMRHKEYISECINMSIIFHPDSSPILKIKFYLDISNCIVYFKWFENSSICELFEIVQEGNSMSCSLQMDDNVITAAQIIAHIKNNIFWDNSNKIETSVFVTLNGVKYLIATQSQMKDSEFWLKFRFRDSGVKDIKDYVNTKWYTAYRYHVHNVKNECRYWIDENSAEADIKKIAESNSLQEAPPAVEKVINEITQDIENTQKATVGCLIMGVIILVIIICISC